MLQRLGMVKIYDRPLKILEVYVSEPTNLQAAMIFGQFKRLNDLVLIKKRILEKV